MNSRPTSIALRKVRTLRRILRSFSPRREWDSLYAAGESERYQTLEQLPRYWMIRGLCEWVSAKPDVLELGCGVALLPASFPPNFFGSYTGLDVSPVALEQAAARFSSGKFIQGKAEEQEFTPNSFDLLILNESIYLIQNFPSVVSRYLTYLRPEGYAIISITHIESEALSIFEREFAPLIRFKDTLTDGINNKCWTVFLLARPSAALH